MDAPDDLVDKLLPMEIHPVLQRVIQIWSVTNSALILTAIVVFLVPLHSRTKSIFLSVALASRTLFLGLWLCLVAYRELLDLIYNLDNILHVALTIVVYVSCRFDVGKARKSQKNVETQLEDLRGQVKDASMNNIRMNRDLAESALSLCRGQGIVMKSFAPTESSEYYQSPFSTLSKHGAARKHEQSEV